MNSVEFLEEIPPLPRSYFLIRESDSFESLIRRFLRSIEFPPEGIFMIGPNYFDPYEIRHIITRQSPHIPLSIPSKFCLSLFSSSRILLQSLFSFFRYYTQNRLKTSQHCSPYNFISVDINSSTPLFVVIFLAIPGFVKPATLSCYISGLNTRYFLNILKSDKDR